MLTKDEARQRVAKGAAYLDKKCPDWTDRIDTGTLTMSGNCFCVMGQLADCTGEWDTLYDRFGITTADHDILFAVTLDNSESKTWNTHTERTADYLVLQDAWIEAIADRRLREDARSASDNGDQRGEGTTADAVRQTVEQPVASIRA